MKDLLPCPCPSRFRTPDPSLPSPLPFAEGLAGIHAATIVPMSGPDFAIDLPALERHLHAVATRPSIRGLLLNGHAGENFMLDRAEKVAVIEAARRVVPVECLIVSGVNTESSLEAAKSNGRIVFPPNSWVLSHSSECVVLSHCMAAAATDLPLMLYGAPVGAGAMAYDDATLRRLAGINYMFDPRV